ncbi:MAG: TasA family protein [Patescibacteria group bacterium]|jgi:predicted ribosomally synthesized peptide with SipW-like signal peptide
MKKKIVISLGVIAIVAAIAIGGTIAYFSDTESSVGNTFKAGKFNLQIDNTCHYNGKVCILDPSGSGKYFWQGTQEECFCTWSAKDLNGELYFNLLDVKPGDSGEDTISLHVDNNDAWMCAEIANLVKDDNGCDSPENKVDSTCGAGEGELQNNLFFTIWNDNGAGEHNCNNIKDEDETYVIQNQTVQAGYWPIADSSLGAPMQGGTTHCLGVKWNVPLATGNEIQTDSLLADIIFTAVQARNLPQFVCNATGGCSPTTEICGNDIDEDCNGSDLACEPTCTPTTEVCNGLDDDCDQVVDEGNPGGGSVCNTGLSGVCSAGTLTCTGGALQCTQNNQAGTEICDNGLDDDCDGSTDNNCSDCTPTNNGVEACDSFDNDCDGATDEDGVCSPETNCHDGIDNEGDGQIDCADYGCFLNSLDCNPVCPDGTCSPSETTATCAADCLPPAPECTSNNDCNNDGVACTVDTCVNGSCVHTPSNNICASQAMNSCLLSTCIGAGGDMWGCVYEASPNVGASCSNLTCMLGGGCNGYTCSAIGACIAPLIPPGGCTSSADCNDNNSCTADSCSATICQHVSLVSLQCTFSGTCSAGVVSCNLNPNCPNNCDDSNACTADICGIAGCAHNPTILPTCTSSSYGYCDPNTGQTGCICYMPGLNYPTCTIDWPPDLPDFGW